MDNFTFYAPTYFVFGKEEDIPDMAKNAVYGNGGSGNIGDFVSLSEEDVANIYRLVL